MMSEDTTDQLTPEEMQELQQFVGAGGNAPAPEEKLSVHKFLQDVSLSDDTTKTGFLKDEEVGVPQHPARTFKGLALIADKIMDNPFFANYFNSESEILTATSLSRDAKLLNLAVIQRRQLEDVTKKARAQNKGWFKGKDKKEDEK